MSVLCVALTTCAIEWEVLPKEVRDDLLRWTTTITDQKEREAEVGKVQRRLRYSPLTAEITALALYDVTREQTILYTTETEVSAEDGWTMVRVCTEMELLERFWEGVVMFDRVVAFTGYQYVWPFLFHRSALLGVLPSVPPPYRFERATGCQFIDLSDRLTFGGLWKRRPSLVQYAYAYQIPYGNEQGSSEGLLLSEVRLIAKLYETWGSDGFVDAY